MATMTQARVQEEIYRHLVSLSNLYAQQNSFLPVFCLPLETLENIFVHAAGDYHERNANGPIAFCVPDWVNVSYVCRHWRSVALSCPTLWTYHFTVSLRWTEELLARSKRASLKICINQEQKRSKSWWSCLVETVLNHAERIQELRLNVLPTILPTQLTLYAPLEILEIGSQGGPSELAINHGDMPPLRTLKLVNYSLPWSSLNLTGVTTLFLEHVAAPFPPDIVDLLSMLSRMQALAVLHLDQSLARAPGFLSSGASHDSPELCFPNLARLFIAGPGSAVLALLSRTTIPIKAQVRLEMSSDNVSGDDYAQISLFLARRFSDAQDLSSSCPIIRSLVIHSHEHCCTLSASEHGEYDSNLSMEYPARDCNVPLTIIASMSLAVETVDILSDICCSISLAHVQTLHVIHPPFLRNFWRKMFGLLDGLRYMKLSDGNIPDLVSLLTLAPDESVEALRVETTAGDHDSTPGHTFIPMLEELELYRILFSPENDLSDDAIYQKSLHRALATRKALRPRLTMIKCEDIDIGEDDDNGYMDDGRRPRYWW